ncbi:hypothetical protein HII36_25550 [Nonomuraea sp. NN258]|uniref:PEP/pyruvate-binding domain-containing protein n=1 Tax=Nonomuraea antri TaxID=2730852 RepID=UPI0015692F9D|nr:PEP/pyruvate-binding domain-containing protein [Nonomuraea antri]NRQ35165.1 hypothetical protein [Nonomuraea antri]
MKLSYRAGIHWLGEAGPAQDPSVVGGKAATLSRLAAGFDVPPGFGVVGESGESEPDEHDIAAAYARLSRLRGQEAVPVAVRSSAIDEDGAQASFAGQNETYLNVRGAEAVVAAVRACVASFGSERALDYRRQHGLDGGSGQYAVLVQELVIADVSGVAFSVDPVSGSRGQVVINASWGLGESVVGGTVTPDTYAYDVGTGDVSVSPADKQRMTVAVAGGTAEVGVPPRLREAPVLSTAQAETTARLALELEKTCGHPVDIEFAWAGGRLHLLQCRPITTLDTPAGGVGAKNESEAGA